MRSIKVPLGILSVSIFGSQALAQIPPSSSPDRLDDRFKPITAPESVPEKPLPQSETVSPSDTELGVSFTLTSVSVEGSTVFTAADFQESYQALLGKEVSISDIYRLRDAVTTKYRAAGFTLSQAIIPPQELASGNVRIQVVEGYISNVSFEGDGAVSSALFKQTARKISASKPLRQSELERYLLLLGDLPGVTVKTVLKPSSAVSAAADLVIVVSRKTVSGALSIDNYGSQAVGPVSGQASVELNNLLGQNEQTNILYATALPVRSLRYIQVQHSRVLNSEGLRVSVSAASSLSKPGGAIQTLSPRGTGAVLNMLLMAPILRSRAQSLKLEVGFSYQNTRTTLLSNTFARDKVRVGSLRASYDAADAAFDLSASTLLSVGINHGFNILGAKKSGAANLSRANGRSDFTSVNAEITRIQSLPKALSLALSVSGQYAFNSLLSSQQYGLGGRRFGRGYEPSELTGDHGLGVSIEPRVDLPQTLVKARVQAYAYFDLGRIWARRPLLGQASSTSISSFGAGLRARIGPHISASFELAKPMTRSLSVGSNRKVQPLFSLSYFL